MGLLAYCWCEGVHVLQRFTNCDQPLHSYLSAVQALAWIDHLQHATDTRVLANSQPQLCMVLASCK